MLKYAKIEDQEKFIVSVGIGTNEEFYRSIGMKLMDITQGWDGNYYVTGHEPTKPEEVIRQEQVDDLKKQLASLDSKYLTQRVLAGLATGDEYAQSQWQAHEAEAAPLREKLAELG